LAEGTEQRDKRGVLFVVQPLFNHSPFLLLLDSARLIGFGSIGDKALDLLCCCRGLDSRLRRKYGEKDRTKLQADLYQLMPTTFITSGRSSSGETVIPR
jgi:hypothetical protein